MSPGDSIIGIASSGIHSNGLSLARQVFFETVGVSVADRVDNLGETVGEALLRPTHIYVREGLDLLASDVPVRALVHITSDGFLNLTRIDAQVGMRIDALPTPPAIFTVLQQLGGIEDAEMYRVFNMGIGFCVIVPAQHEARAISKSSARTARRAMRIGTVVDDADERVWVEQARAGRPRRPGLCGGAPRPGLARTMARCTAPECPCQDRAMQRSCSRARIRTTQRESERESAGGVRGRGRTYYIPRPQPFRRGRHPARTTLCDTRATLQARATRACGTLDSAPATFQARATSHLSHLIPLNPGESRLELNVYPSHRVLRPAPGGAKARAPRRESRLNRGRRCPPRASPRDRAGRGRAERRSRPEQARPALRGRASRRASP